VKAYIETIKIARELTPAPGLSPHLVSHPFASHCTMFLGVGSSANNSCFSGSCHTLNTKALVSVFRITKIKNQNPAAHCKDFVVDCSAV
jgi:hypothetical protein